MMYGPYSFTAKIKFTAAIKSKHTKQVISTKDQKNSQYFYVCENYLAEEIKSISEFGNFYDLYSNLFHSSSCQIVHPYFGNKIQSDKGKQEDRQHINQTHDKSKCSSSVHNFDNSLQS
jgi:hypothetical protein